MNKFSISKLFVVSLFSVACIHADKTAVTATATVETKEAAQPGTFARLRAWWSSGSVAPVVPAPVVVEVKKEVPAVVKADCKKCNIKAAYAKAVASTKGFYNRKWTKTEKFIVTAAVVAVAVAAYKIGEQIYDAYNTEVQPTIRRNR